MVIDRSVLHRIPKRWVRAGGAILAIATSIFVVVAVVRQWDDLATIVRDADPGWLVASVAVFAAAELGYALAWPATLRRAGFTVGWATGAATFLVTQTAKFVPGAVWQHVGRVGSSDRLGVPKRVVAGALLIEAAASVAAATFIGAATGTLAPLVVDDVGAGWRTLELAVGTAVLIGAPLAGARAASRVAGRRLLDERGSVLVVAWHTAVWVAYGLAAGLLAVGLGAPLGPTVGAFALSWVAGFLVVGAPAGLGVREAVMVAALAPTAGADAALAVSVGSRVVWTAVQLGGAALALPRAARARRGRDGDVDLTPDPPGVPC